ncbi:MAG: serine/threonine-protein kinase [Pirellulales bacterium]
MALESTEQLLSLLERSRLIKPAVLEKALDTIAAETGKLPGDPNVVMAKLIDAKLITPWQADKIQEGRYKGFLLGNYKLLGHLGTGGMSSVYLAEHIHMQRRAAIKVLPQNRVDDSSYLDRFYLEARATAVLNHRNIVKVYDVDNDGNNHFIVMEFVDGYDLQELVEHAGKSLPVATVVEYIRQAAEGLSHAHELGMVHRDIKPANLLVDQEGTIKILDMGLARFDDETEASLTLAHGENVLGTADYLAPEQAINSHDVDARADIYSLGCTMYFLLTGQPPFPEGTLTQRLMKHQTEEPKSILAIRPDVPTDLVAICNKMMAKNPDNRFESAGIVSETMGRGCSITAKRSTRVRRAIRRRFASPP